MGALTRLAEVSLARFASVVLDIPTRALTTPYDYAVPCGMDVAVGSTVLANFSGRPAVGYVVAVSDDAPEGVDASKIKPLEQVLASPAFCEAQAQLGLWMAREYAAPLNACFRLLLPPGQTVKVTKGDSGWALAGEVPDAPEDTWVSLTEKGREYVPRANALRQREVLEALAQGPQRLADLAAVAPGSRSAVTALKKRGVVSVANSLKTEAIDQTSLSSAAAPRPETLTRGQRDALAAIAAARKAADGSVVLVDGVTGSGKTEVYLQAIEQTLAEGKTAIVLVPEISLTAQTVGRFRGRFGDAVSILHSRLSTGERRQQWELARRGRSRVVVGARSALFAPLKDVGLIVVDEEHETSYKQDQAPRYHAREAAAELARLHGAALVLGSATPSMESLERCQQGAWRGAPWVRVSMPERPGGALLPTVSVIDMRQQFKDANNSPLSVPLRQALVENHKAGGKSVLFLNRRGFATFLMCRDCGCVPTCPHCSTSLTYHERTRELACHTCGSRWPAHAYPDPGTVCPGCGGRYLASYGVGTQRVEDELRALLPGAPIIRMDADTTKAKGAHQKLLEEFDASPGAVLIGTQMIAKGLDFPDVTLVGVVNADTSLKMPDFRAAERTFDLLEQVSGRAGRGDKPGRVLVQTYWPTHPAISSVAAHDRAQFVRYEMAMRRESDYPPFTRVGNVTVSSTNEVLANRVVGEVSARLREATAGRPGWQVLGPSDCLKAKAKDRFRRHVLVKAPLSADLGAVLADACRSVDSRGTSVAIDVDACDLM